MMQAYDWKTLGLDLRRAALDAHDGRLPTVEFAYSFLLDNPECFGYDEWPPEMPTAPNIEIIGGYYNAYPEVGGKQQ